MSIRYPIRCPTALGIDAEGQAHEMPDNEFTWWGHWSDEERPGWNTVRLEVRGDAARYDVNGVQVNAISNARFGGLL